MTLDEARGWIGEEVAYRPAPGAKTEYGRVTSVGETMVFVRYDGDTGSKATRPEDLFPVGL